MFERAYKKSGRAPLLYNIALTAERLGRLQRAIEAYRAYISALPEGELARESRTRIRSLTAMQENLSPTRAAGSEQGEDDVPAIDISNDPDKTEASDGEASGPTPSPHDDPPAATPAQWYRQWWVWTVAGSVLAGGLTAALLVGPLSGGASEPPLDASAGKLVMTLRIQR